MTMIAESFFLPASQPASIRETSDAHESPSIGGVGAAIMPTMPKNPKTCIIDDPTCESCQG